MVPATLESESDVAKIAVSAVLEDHSRIQLTASNGLHLSTNDNSTIIINQNGELEVPANPSGGSGPLIHVAWQPTGACFTANHGLTAAAERDVNLTVTVQPPTDIRVNNAPAFL